MKNSVKLYLEVAYHFLIIIFFINLNYQLGILSDKYNSSPDALLGANYWNLLTWGILLFSFIMFIVAIVKVVKLKNGNHKD